MPLDTLATRLVIARVHAGHFNAASAAMACGVTRQSWSNWERGGHMQHMESMVAHIARCLNVDEDWLRDGGPLAPAPEPNDPTAAGDTDCYRVAATAGYTRLMAA